MGEKDELNYSKKKLVASIEVALGGRAAEELFLGPGLVTTGCSSDLESATRTAFLYVRDMGMLEDLSLLSAKKEAFSDRHNALLDAQANALVRVRPLHPRTATPPSN